MSRFPIVKLSEKWEQMQSEPRILSVRTSIEVIRARILELLQRVDQKDAPDRLAKLYELWQDYEEALDDDKMSDAIVLRRKIRTQFEKAINDLAVWQQIYQAIDLDRKLVESEVKVVKEIKAMLTAEDARELVARMLAIITRHVKDAKLLKAIQFDFVKMIGERPSDYPNPNVVDAEIDEDDVEIEL